jgi:hypothetical protein
MGLEVQVEGSGTPFAVYCSRCQASFAAGTKRCVHCGDRLVRGHAQPSIFVSPPLETPPEFADEELSRTRSRISPISILWIVAALAVGIQRACAT